MLFVEYKGIKVPRLGMGTWQQTGEDCINAVQQALAAGYRHIDTAQIYENEAEVGRAIAQSDTPRDAIFLTTKIWLDNMEPSKLEGSLNNSLRDLQTDYVDMLLLHWPNDAIPMSDMIRALEAVRDAGKTRLIGVSNYTSSQLTRAVDELGASLATNQVEYHPYLSQKPILDVVRPRGMFLTSYSPLARGKAVSESLLKQIGEKYDKSAPQVALRWQMQQDAVVAIPKGSGEHIDANLAIFDFTLSDEDMDRINLLARADGRLINPDFAPDWDEATTKHAA